MPFWTEQDVDELRRLWWAYTPQEVQALMPKYSIKAIGKKAYTLKMPRSEETTRRIRQAKQELLVKRNTTTLGRPRNYETARQVALLYKTRTEFWRKDASMYRYVINNGLWDELCAHMYVGNFNYSESFLFECIRDLFPGSAVVRNSRKIISPYELDVYVPEKKLAFEYDGCKWHSAADVQERDGRKSQKCNDMGIMLYRIKETRDQGCFPEDFIMQSLLSFGFPANQLDKEDCSVRAFNSGYSEDDIRKTISQYSSLKEFRKNEMPLYQRMGKRGVRNAYLAELSRCRAAYTPELIDAAIAVTPTAAEFRSRHRGMYWAMKNNPEKFAAQLEKYESLRVERYRPVGKSNDGEVRSS